jgi:hypothetical protein
MISRAELQLASMISARLARLWQLLRLANHVSLYGTAIEEYVFSTLCGESEKPDWPRLCSSAIKTYL